MKRTVYDIKGQVVGDLDTNKEITVTSYYEIASVTSYYDDGTAIENTFPSTRMLSPGDTLKVSFPSTSRVFITLQT